MQHFFRQLLRHKLVILFLVVPCASLHQSSDEVLDPPPHHECYNLPGQQLPLRVSPGDDKVCWHCVLQQ